MVEKISSRGVWVSATEVGKPMRLLSKAMKVLLAGMLGVGFGFVEVASADVPRPPSICVLTYERDGSPIAGGVLNVYENYSKATVTTEAVPADIIQCIDQGATEIVIIAHAVEIQNLKEIRLGYFVRAANPGKDVEAPYYELELFLDHVFAAASDALLAQEKAGVRRLTKIRMMACDPGDVLKAYPSLQKLIQYHSIAFDTAQTSPILSLFSDVPKTGFNTAWLAQDINCADLTSSWRTDQNSWCEQDGWPNCDRSTAQYCLPAKK